MDGKMIFYTVSQKRPTLWLSISLPNVNLLANFFHWHSLWTTGNKKLLNIPPHLLCITTLPHEEKLTRTVHSRKTLASRKTNNNRQKHVGKQKSLQIKIAMNDLHDATLYQPSCGFPTNLACYTGQYLFLAFLL